MGSENRRSLGTIVGDTPALQPSTETTLSGRYVTVAGMTSDHLTTLWSYVSGPENDNLWDYMLSGPFKDEAEFRATIEAQMSLPNMVFYAIIPADEPTTADGTTANVVGCASYLNINPPHRTIEIGTVLYSRRLQRTLAATEAMYLLMRHAFEDLNYRRYEWKANALNEASRRAAQRLGFTPEGLFRQHMVVKGRNRDTAWFSIVDGEWPTVRAGFDGWLDPANFDEAGKQRRKLEDFRGNR